MNKGYGTETMRAMLRHVLNPEPAPHLAAIYANNKRGIRLMKSRLQTRRGYREGHYRRVNIMMYS